MKSKDISGKVGNGNGEIVQVKPTMAERSP